LVKLNLQHYCLISLQIVILLQILACIHPLMNLSIQNSINLPRIFICVIVGFSRMCIGVITFAWMGCRSARVAYSLLPIGGYS
jgi:hypothetical protein